MNENQKYFDFVVNSLDKRTILEQLVEESSEITKAALKVIRAERFSRNITPITYEESLEKLIEEINDTRMIINLLKSKYKEFNDSLPEDREVINNPKWKRWDKRLGYVE